MPARLKEEAEVRFLCCQPRHLPMSLNLKRRKEFFMDTEELTRYKNMSVDEIDQRLVPDIEDIKSKGKG